MTSCALGLVGSGIARSLTPAMHELEGRAQGINLTYRRFDLDTAGLSGADLPEILQWARRFGFDGLNITHPCKQLVIPLLDALDPDAEAIGAVNTVVFDGDVATGFNTDSSGFRRGLLRSIPDVATGSVVQLGAGGAGAATAHALLGIGVPDLVVCDPEPARSQELVERLQARFGADRARIALDPADALRGAVGVVNASPIGSDGHPGAPLDLALLRPGLWVADVIYFPVETPLILQARKLGCAVATGAGMATFQAVAAFEHFTGLQPDADRMDATFRQLLDERDLVNA